MIISNQHLLNIFKSIYLDKDLKYKESRFLQIRSIDDKMEFAILYNGLSKDSPNFLKTGLDIYVSYTCDKNSLYEIDSDKEILMFFDDIYFNKLYFISKYEPHGLTKFIIDGEHISVEFISIQKNNSLFSLKDIQFEFIVENQINNIVFPPICIISESCKILTDTLIKMIEFCQIQEQNIDISLEKTGTLLIKNEEGNIATSSECSEYFKEIFKGSKTEKQSFSKKSNSIIIDSIKSHFIIKLLNKIMKSKICNLYLVKNLPFIIENENIKIYSSHVI